MNTFISVWKSLREKPIWKSLRDGLVAAAAAAIVAFADSLAQMPLPEDSNVALTAVIAWGIASFHRFSRRFLPA